MFFCTFTLKPEYGVGGIVWPFAVFSPRLYCLYSRYNCAEYSLPRLLSTIIIIFVLFQRLVAISVFPPLPFAVFTSTLSCLYASLAAFCHSITSPSPTVCLFPVPLLLIPSCLWYMFWLLASSLCFVFFGLQEAACLNSRLCPHWLGATTFPKKVRTEKLEYLRAAVLWQWVFYWSK